MAARARLRSRDQHQGRDEWAACGIGKRVPSRLAAPPAMLARRRRRRAGRLCWAWLRVSRGLAMHVAMCTRCVAGMAVTPETRSPPITPRRASTRGCCRRGRARSCCGRARARGRCERGHARGDCGRGAPATCAASGWGCQRGCGRGATARAAEARRRVRVTRGRRGGVRCRAGGRRWEVVREVGRSGRARLCVCLGVRAEQCSPPYGVGARPARYRRRRWVFITLIGGWISPLALADYHPLGAAGRRARRRRRRRRCPFLVGCLSPLRCVHPRRDRPRGTHRLWNAAIKAAHGNGPRDWAEGDARGYEWRRLSAEEALAYRAREFHRETLFRLTTASNTTYLLSIYLSVSK